MNDSERAKLVEKARKDVDDFISNLKPKKYEDGWPEDKWEEEMDKHPIFMSKPLQEGQDMPPLIEALQQLKYDPEFNSPRELATSYKEDGNENFKQKKYSWAIDSYTKGLEAKCDDNELNSVLYSNRATSKYYLGNYRNSLDDAIKARELNPQNIKALQRGAMCYLELGKYENCISWCDEGLKVKDTDKVLEELKKNAQEKKDKDKKLIDVALRKQKRLHQKLFRINQTLQQRGISVKGGILYESDLKNPQIPEEHVSKVQITPEGVLVWPVVLLYPEHNRLDYIRAFNEESCFKDHLIEVFSETPEWDTKRKYIPKNLQVYFTSCDDKIVPVDKLQPLKAIMTDKRFILSSGTLEFIVTVTNSKFDKTYRAQHQ